MNGQDFLEHYGIMGMKWKHHIKREKDFRKKLSTILKNKQMDVSDRKLFEERNHSLAERFVKSATSATRQVLIRDLLTGQLKNYKTMSKYEAMKRLKTIATATATSMATNEAFSRSAAAKYTSDGKLIKGKNRGIMTREDAMQIGMKAIPAVMKVYPYAKVLLGMKISQIKRQRAKNEETFNRWGANILTDKVDNIVWQSSDLKRAIIDNRGR